MAAGAADESRSQQQRFDRAGKQAQDGLAGIGARLAAFRDAAAQRLPFLGKQRPADSASQTFFCSGVAVRGVEGPLQQLAQQAVLLQPGRDCSVQEVKESAAAVFGTGFFSSCATKANDTRDGTEIFIEVEPNPTLRGVRTQGTVELPPSVVNAAFQGQEGGVINFSRFGQSLKAINGWYQQNGVFGQITHAGVNQQDEAELVMVEMPVQQVVHVCTDRDSHKTVPKGRTRPHVVFRELATRPGKIFRLDRAAQDVERLYATGLFDFVDLLPRASGTDTEQRSVEVVLNTVEKKAVNASGGVGVQPGEGLASVLGSATFSHNNLFGCGQSLDFAVDAGQTMRTFRLSHKDPWVGTGRQRVSQTLSAARTSFLADGVYAADSDEARGQAPMVSRTAGGVRYGTPLKPWWKLGAAVACEHTQFHGPNGQPLTKDGYGRPLTHSGQGHDRALVASLDSTLAQPDAYIRASLDQGLPVGGPWLSFTKGTVRAEALRALPGGLTAWVSLRGGAAARQLPPHEAFTLGGPTSVRGYREGALGTGSRYTLANAELWLPVAPLAKQVREALHRPEPASGGVEHELQLTAFFDCGTDWGSADRVLGAPAAVRGKPGQGWGTGVGVKARTPLGPLRLEYAVNDRHQRPGWRLNVGSMGML